ncbi:hypothetical protein A9G34_09780 [Gilliamella sp. Choc4-2]|jgi:hypothetical protein|uniref:FeoC-like transcriptional regulator n=1 Tax=unclassified Gilliamella TaxID=2685620 RepID=UPI00080E1630|nr:hypothetical protein A9G33_03700 [Gilliamella apicola]OCG43090.1 hypothetical protein A9G34_09780 [Gilliamella apicola]OCG54742.1 hypothetical protein A9G36_07885 [Gilliamella apicola]
MLITSIRDYVQLKGRVELHNISNHFRLPESAVEQMLVFWIKKGKIQQIILKSEQLCKTNQCSSCLSCHLKPKFVYVWI